MFRKTKIYLTLFILAVTLPVLLTSCDIIDSVMLGFGSCCPLIGVGLIAFPLLLVMFKNDKLD